MPESSLYRSVLGERYNLLPDAVRRMHDGGVRRASGHAKVQRGEGVVARVVCFFFGFPATGDAVPVTVTFERTGTREVWCRTFDRRQFRSVQSPGSDNIIFERFGLVSPALQVTASTEALMLVPTNASLWGILIPRILAPSGHGIENEIDGLFAFDVEIRLLGRRIVTYAGKLRPFE